MTWISSFPCDISIKYTKSVFYFCSGFVSSILWLKIKISSGNPDVCMYVRMYVCIYMCVCMVCMLECTYVGYVCMYARVFKHVYVLMYDYIYVLFVCRV